TGVDRCPNKASRLAGGRAALRSTPGGGRRMGAGLLFDTSIEGEFTEGVANLGQWPTIPCVVKLVGQEHRPAAPGGGDPHACAGEAVVHPDVLLGGGAGSGMPE